MAGDRRRVPLRTRNGRRRGDPHADGRRDRVDRRYPDFPSSYLDDEKPWHVLSRSCAGRFIKMFGCVIFIFAIGSCCLSSLIGLLL